MRKYEKEYKEWLETNPVCACGCGQRMTSSFASFVDAMARRNSPPIFREGHFKRYQYGEKKRQINTIEANFNGCRIKLFSTTPKRCQDYNTCGKRLDCLEFVVIEKKAYGWERVP